jgi:hypothetical protein
VEGERLIHTKTFFWIRVCYEKIEAWKRQVLRILEIHGFKIGINQR